MEGSNRFCAASIPEKLQEELLDSRDSPRNAKIASLKLYSRIKRKMN